VACPSEKSRSWLGLGPDAGRAAAVGPLGHGASTSGEVQTWDACVAHLWAQYRQRPDDEAGTFARALERELGALWTFIVEEGVEPTNNRAERALQCAVLWRRLMRCGRIDWHAIALLYEGLVRAAPTLGALVGRAAALAEASGPAAGFALLDDITPERVKTYQPYWRCACISCAGSDARPRRLTPSIARSV